MSLIVLPVSQPQSRSHIGYQNLLELGTVVSSSEDAAFPAANAFDWNTFDYFRPAGTGTINITLTLPSGMEADYFAFYGQDIYLNGGNIRLQYYDGANWIDATAGITPSDNKPRMVLFDGITATQWRVQVQTSALFNLACVSFGKRLTLEHGSYMNWTPPELARTADVVSNISDRGVLLGRSVIATGISTDLVLQFASDAWVRANWPAFVKHAESKPFFWLANARDYPVDAVLCWTRGQIPPPTHTQYGHMGTTIPVDGVAE